MKHVAVVFNPMGGSARRATLDALIACLRQLGLEVIELPTTAAPGSARELARQAAAMDMDLVIAFGGDGTASQVAEGLLGSGVTMAVFPGGTGNLFARTFFSEPTPAQFAQMVVRGTPQPVDLLAVEHSTDDGGTRRHLSLVATEIGTFSDAIIGASPAWKRAIGRLVYVGNIMVASLTPQKLRLQVETPSGRQDLIATAMFALNVGPPGLAGLSKGCNASDGLVDIVLVKATNFWDLLCAGTRFLFGTTEHSPHVVRLRTPTATVACQRPVQLDIDGDHAATVSNFNLTVLSGAVRMILA